MAAELATGYISLTVKYADAMKKINADFQNVSKTAKTSGDKAGKQFSQGVEKSAKGAAKSLDNTFKNTASSAASAGRSSGSKFAQAFQQQMKGALKLDKAADGSGASAVGGKVGKLFAAGIAAGIAAVGITKIFDQVLQQFQAVVDVGLSYERQMNNLKGVTGATAADMAKLQATARALGSDVNLAGTSSADAASALTELAKSGMSADQAISAARGTLQLATAGQVSAAEAAEMVSTAMNTFSIDYSKGTEVADDFSAAVLASSLDMPDLAQALQAGGSAAAGFGISFQDTLSTLGAFAQLGVKGSDAGTMLKTSLLAWQSPSEAQAGAMADLNLQLTDANGNFVGYRNMMGQLETASKRMTQAEFNSASATLFGTDAFRAAALVRIGATKHFDRIHKELEGEGQAAEMAAAQMSGATGAIEGFNNTLEGIRLDVFDSLGPAIEDAMKQLTDALTSNKDLIKDVFIDLAKFAVDFAERFIWAIGVTMQAVGDLVGGIGNIKGALDEAMSVMARIRGDSAGADAFHKSAQEAYGWGENIREAGNKLANVNFDSLRTGLDNAASSADNASTKVGALGTKLGTLPTDVSIKVDADTSLADAVIERWVTTVTGMPPPKIPVTTAGPTIMPGVPLTSSPPPPAPRAGGGSIRGPGGPKSDIIPIWASSGEHMFSARDVQAMGGQSAVYAFRRGLHGFAGGGALSAAPGFGEANLQYYSVLVGRAVMANFPQIKEIGGYRPSDPYPWHPSGRAVDIMMPTGDTRQNPAGKPLGDAIYAYLDANKAAFGIENMLWQTLTGGNHFNHIHVQTKEAGGPAPANATYALAGGVPSGGGGGADVAAAQNRVATAKGKVAEAQAKQRELKSDAKESDRIAAQNDVDEANRDLAEAEADLAEATSSAAGGVNDTLSQNPYAKLVEAIKGILPDFGELADIGIGGVKEAFLPEGFSDPTQWKSVASFGGMLQAIGTLSGNQQINSLLGGIGAGVTGSGSGFMSGLMGAIPQPFGDLATSQGQPGAGQQLIHGGTGALPGPGSLPLATDLADMIAGTDNSVHIAEGGQINADAQGIVTNAQRQQKSNTDPFTKSRRWAMAGK